LACFSPISFPQHCRPPGPGFVQSTSVPQISHIYRRPNSMAMTTYLLSSQLCLHITTATGLIHALQSGTLEIENLNAAVIILKLGFLGCQPPVRIAALRFDLPAFSAEAFEFAVKAFDLPFERMMLRKPQRYNPCHPLSTMGLDSISASCALKTPPMTRAPSASLPPDGADRGLGKVEIGRGAGARVAVKGLCIALSPSK
jgi:hypothetical protein